MVGATLVATITSPWVATGVLLMILGALKGNKLI